MDLSELINRRQAEGAGSLRDMADRAAAAGHRISHAQIGQYAAGKVRTYPAEPTRHALAAALGVTVDEVSAAAMQTAAPELVDGAGMELQHARAFIRETRGRSDAEIIQLLGVVRAAIKAMDAGRNK